MTGRSTVGPRRAWTAAWEWLPHGRTLSPDDWLDRHRAMLVVLWLHVGGLMLFGSLRGYGVLHTALEVGAIATLAIVANLARLSPKARSVAVSLGLLSASAILVHFSDGAIEAHFHFFVIVSLLALYEDWLPFGVAVGFVALQHGLGGLLVPGAVFNHADAGDEAVRWALIHSAFVLAGGAVNIVGWRLNEQSRMDARRMAQIVESSDDAIIGKDLDGTVISWNAGASRIFGFAPEEIVGRNISAVMPLEPPDDMGALLERINRGDRLVHFETKLTRKDGRAIDVSLVISPINDARGNVVGAATIARDVTERKLVEDRLARSQAELAAAQELAGLGRWSWDLGSGEIRWSAELFRIWDLDPGEHRPNYELFVDSLHPDDRPGVADSIQAAIAERSGFDIEYRVMRPNGEVRFVSAAGRVMVDEAGEPVRVLGSVLDVTERKQTENELRRAADRLQEQALTDPLTGLLNHGGFHDAVDRELARGKRYASRFSVILFDLDGFKAINDTYGHAEGDRILVEVATALRSSCRPSDVAGRLGGDEFAVLLPETNGESAVGAAERAKRAIEELGHVGISFGVGAWPEDGPEKETVFLRADVALYAAKPSTRDGRRLVEAGRLAEAITTAGARRSADPHAAGVGEQQAMRGILDAAREQLGMDVAYVSEFADGRQVFRSVQGDGEPLGLRVGAAIPLEDSFCQRVVGGRLPNVVPDTLAEPEVSALPITHESGIRSYVGVPVCLSDGRLYGTLCCASRTPNPGLADRDAAFLRVLARLIGAQLEHDLVVAQSRRLELEVNTIDALLAALDARDNYTGEHSACVVGLARQVASRLGLSPEAVNEVEQVALLHDIGKLGVPDSILRKPTRLDAEEWAVMREHPKIGAQIISSIETLAHLAGAIRSEHERWDGKGYPDGLAGEAIPIASRIVFACDAYHAMTSTRPYRAAMPAHAARQELERNAGTQFDPTVVGALLDVLEREEQGEQQARSARTPVVTADQSG